MPGIVIPLAGFIVAASLVLLIVFGAAYGGAFTQMSDGAGEQKTVFDAPDSPDKTYPRNELDESPNAQITVTIKKFSVGNGMLSYDIKLMNQSANDATVQYVNCVFYKNGVSVGSCILSGQMLLDSRRLVNLTGTEKTNGADSAALTIKWTDEDGRSVIRNWNINIR